MKHHGASCCTCITLTAAVIAISLPLLMTYHHEFDYYGHHPAHKDRWVYHHNVRISYGLWHICVKGLPHLDLDHPVHVDVHPKTSTSHGSTRRSDSRRRRRTSSASTSNHTVTVDYYPVVRAGCWDDYCCEETKHYGRFDSLAWNFPTFDEPSDTTTWNGQNVTQSSLDDIKQFLKDHPSQALVEPGTYWSVANFAGWYDDIVTVQWLYVSATAVLFLASCSAGAVYHSPQAGFVSCFLHFSAGVLFLAAGSYTVDKIKRPDEMNWNFTFAWLWIAWILTWIIAVLSAMAALEAGKDGDEHEREPLGDSKQRSYEAAETGSA